MSIINVSTTESVKANQDLAVLSVKIKEIATNVDQAVKQTEQKEKDMLKELSKISENENLKLISSAVRGNFENVRDENGNSASKQNGFVSTRDYKIVTDSSGSKFAQIAEIFQNLDIVYFVSFDVKDQEVFQEKALALAVESAWKKGSFLASLNDEKIVDVLTVNYNHFHATGSMAMRGGNMEASVVDKQISATVEMRFKAEKC